jgi:hypothetical protein
VSPGVRSYATQEENNVEQPVHQPEQSEQPARQPYETPEILDTFDAQDVMGAAEGLVGNGSIVVSTDTRFFTTGF